MLTFQIAAIARNPLVHQDWLDEQGERLTSSEHVSFTRRKASLRAGRSHWAS